MDSSAKAFTLLEFLIVILVLSVLISAILGSLAVVGLDDLGGIQNAEIYNVPICNKVAPNCIFHSPILDSTRVYEINATIP